MYSSRCCPCWGDRFKKAQRSVVTHGIGMKSLRIVLLVNPHPIFDLKSPFQDGGRDVISCKKTAATWWVITKPLASAASASFWSVDCSITCTSSFVCFFFIFCSARQIWRLSTKLLCPPQGGGCSPGPTSPARTPMYMRLHLTMYPTIELTD